MKAISLQINYQDGKPFAAYIYLSGSPGQKAFRTEEVAPEVLVDYASDGTPLGIEIVSPGYIEIEEIVQLFDRLGIGRPDPRELAPLRAA
ncbi:MAG TPA: DUF2283 domain-containing protein [Longimicrobiaceae bacterium]|nr:DUF2283 domain-containing protein [Longimicrobiaceae bacterium]